MGKRAFTWDAKVKGKDWGWLKGASGGAAQKQQRNWQHVFFSDRKGRKWLPHQAAPFFESETCPTQWRDQTPLTRETWGTWFPSPAGLLWKSWQGHKTTPKATQDPGLQMRIDVKLSNCNGLITAIILEHPSLPFSLHIWLVIYCSSLPVLVWRALPHLQVEKNVQLFFPPWSHCLYLGQWRGERCWCVLYLALKTASPDLGECEALAKGTFCAGSLQPTLPAAEGGGLLSAAASPLPGVAEISPWSPRSSVWDRGLSYKTRRGEVAGSCFILHLESSPCTLLCQVGNAAQINPAHKGTAPF